MNEMLFGLTKQYLLNLCLSNSFPGTIKWPANHPIWDCNVYNKKTPKQAWSDIECLKKAIDNLFYIVNKSITENKYEDFVKKIHLAFIKRDISLLRIILNRFTIAKIAPKVTALQPSYFKTILNETALDLSCGVYCPMAGFGGIIQGAKNWFKEHDISENIEAYDINPNFCNWYGWGQRDVLSQKIKTDKIVIACPPFGDKTEQWEGTPNNRDDLFNTNYLDFHDWCKLIKEYITAPNYVLIGPELGKSKKKNNNCGLFSKSMGIQWYPEYTE